MVWREKQINFQSEETTTKWINTFVWEVFRRKWCHASSAIAENDVNPIHEREEEVASR